MNNPRVAIDSQRLLLWTAVVGSIAYIAIAWSKNFDLADDDTLSQYLAWKLLIGGQQLDTWTIATPKLLQILIDGPINALFGSAAALTRSIVVAFAAAVGGGWVVHRYWGPWPAAACLCLLMSNRTVFNSVISGNSTALFSALLIGAVWLWSRGSRPLVVLSALGLAAICRTEGICFLGLAALGYGLSWWRSRDRRSLQAVGVAIVLSALAFGLDTVVPTVLSGAYRTNAEITKIIDQSATRKAQRDLARGGELAYDLRRFVEVEASYLSIVSELLPRLFRPWSLYLLGVIAGIAVWWRQHPTFVAVIVATGVAPLVYCAALHWLGYALFDRFFLPMVFPAVVLTIGALVGLATRMPRQTPAAVGVIVAMLLAVNARDIYYAERGYLKMTTDVRSELRGAIDQLVALGSDDVDLVLPENQWLLANLILPDLISRARRTGVFFEDSSVPADLNTIEFVLIDRQEGWYSIAQRKMNQRGFAPAWQSPANRFEIWAAKNK